MCKLASRVATWAVGAAALLFTVAVLWLLGIGGGATVIATPSMSPSLQVGSLALILPAHSPVRPGQVIMFTPPGEDHTYVHRVIKVVRNDGAVRGYRTQGDEVGRPDPWLITPSEVKGRVFSDIPGLGWLKTMAPYFFAGVTLVMVLSFLWPKHRRWIILNVTCATFLAIDVVVHPLVNWMLITTTHTRTLVQARIANTGLAPLYLRAEGGSSLTLSPGHFGIITAPLGEQVHVVGSLALGDVGTIIVTLICLVPLIAAGWSLRHPQEVRTNKELVNA